MSDIDDGSEDVERIHDALELPRDEIDDEARERHLARALGEFDDAPARVVPMRRRRLVSIAAAAAVVLAVVAVGALIATRGTHDPSATRAADQAASATEHATTTVTAPSSSPAFGPNTPSGSLGDFPTVDALRAAITSRYSALDSTARASSAAAPSVAPVPLAPRGCPTPALDGRRVVDRVPASVAGAPVTVWIVDGDRGALGVIVVDDATCTVRSR